jgi:hypothetical protein
MRKRKFHPFYVAMRLVVQAQVRGKPLKCIGVAMPEGDVLLLRPTWSALRPMDLAGGIMARIEPRYQASFSVGTRP